SSPGRSPWTRSSRPTATWSPTSRSARSSSPSDSWSAHFRSETMPKPPAKTAYVLLFRGVGGATQLPTAPLREALTAAGFENVATYITSGNAVLRSESPRDVVIAKVAEICKDRFGFTKAILAPTLEEWSALIDNNPFPQAVATPKCLHAAVLAEKPSAEAVTRLRGFAAAGEGIEVIGNVA